MNWALEEMERREGYLSGKVEEDLEDFVLDLLLFVRRKPRGLDLSAVRAALMKVTVCDDPVYKVCVSSA